jgi:hypothetical protein
VDNCVQISFFLFKINEKLRMVRNMADGFRKYNKGAYDEKDDRLEQSPPGASW